MANVTKGLTGNPEVDSKLQSLKNIGYVVESCTVDDYVKDIKEQIRDHPRFELNREPGPSDNVTRPSDTQVGGSHYKNMPIQPVKFITANDLGFCEGNVVKYICRYKEKGQVEDLQKAKHYIDLLIESME